MTKNKQLNLIASAKMLNKGVINKYTIKLIRNRGSLTAGGFVGPCLQRQGALPPDPLPPASEGFAPRPPKQPPQFEFLATPLLSVLCAMR